MPEIERLKGMAIILVAWGHVYHASLPEPALWMRTFIYSFHMPVFMFMSGYVLAHSGDPLGRMSLRTYAGRRFERLMIPFAAMALIVIAGKLVAQHFLAVRGAVSSIPHALATVFVHTDDSPVVFIWYLAVVFAFSILTVYAVYARRIAVKWLFVLSLAMYGLHVATFSSGIRTDYLYLNKALMFYYSFVLGMVVYRGKEKMLAVIDRWWPAAFLLMAAAGSVMLANEWRYLVVGAVACLAFLGLSRSRFLPFKAAFAFLGKHSFAIYLLNMPFVGLTLGVLERLYGIAPLGYAAVVIPAIFGLLGPIAIKMTLQALSPFRPIARAME